MAEQIADMDKQILYFNLEMTDEQIYERMLATETGFPLFKIKRTLRLSDEKEEQIVNDAKERIRQRKIRVVTGSQKVSEIRQVSRRIKPDIVIVDYLQLVQSDANYNGNRYAEVGQISHDLKALALELKIPVVVLTQLNRVAKATTEPSMNEIRESGDIEQDASVIILLWNTDETDYSKKGIKVDKNRQGQLNKWENRFEFDGNSMRFVDVETFHKAKDDEIATITGGDLPLLETETQEQNFREIIVEHIEDAESEIIENTENDSEIAETEITEIAENKEKINFDDVEFTPIGEEKPPF
jgi:replicative DNA helicase